MTVGLGLPSRMTGRLETPIKASLVHDSRVGASLVRDSRKWGAITRAVRQSNTASKLPLLCDFVKHAVAVSEKRCQLLTRKSSL